MTSVGFQVDLRLCWPKLTMKGRSHVVIFLLYLLCTNQFEENMFKTKLAFLGAAQANNENQGRIQDFWKGGSYV